MTKLVMTKGLPASGKTTWAKQQKDFVRVNKDDLRAMLHSEPWSEKQEITTLLVRDAAIQALLANGRDVICDDTNFAQKHEIRLKQIVKAARALFEIKDFTDVSLKTCLERDAKRDKPVGEKVIRDMWEKYLKPPEEKKIVAPFLNRTEAVICDIDGTVADYGTHRGPYDWDKVDLDEPRLDVIKAVKAVSEGRQLIFVSGRKDVCWDKTFKWLARYFPTRCAPGGTDPMWQLYMRKNSDNRKDYETKKEIYKTLIEPYYEVKAVFDDRPQVVALWHELGLPLFNVGNGKDF